MNLWAESDNLEIASTPVDHAPKSGTTRRTSTEQAILPALRSWLLADYVAPYCRSLAATRIFRRCFWIDALGNTRTPLKKADVGQWRNESHPYIFDDLNGAEQSNHSLSRPGKAPKKAPSETLPPALQTVAALSGELARESKPITLQGIALDTTRSVGTRFIASAPPSTSPNNTFVLPKEHSAINASWRESAPALLPAIEQSATIFLVNPLAITRPGATVKGEVPFLMADELAPLVQRTAPTELCMLLMHRQVEGVFLPALHTATGASAFTALLRSDRWKAPLTKLLAKEGENGARVERAIDLWRACLQPHFSFVQCVSFPLLIGPATVEDAPCSLLFATRRQDSLVCMSDAVCSYRRRLEQESLRGILNEAWFAAQQAERDAQGLQQLNEDLLREGRARAPRRWPDLRQQLLLERFGQWTLRDYDELICRLLQADEVRCTWRQGNPTDLAGRVPGNDDILQWQWKKRHY